MSISSLINELQQRRISLSVVDGKLRFEAPEGAMDEPLKARLRENRDALLELFGSSAESALIPARSSNVGAASAAQEGLWFIEQLGVRSETYAVCMAWRCKGELDVAALQGSLNDLVVRHESLRTTFHSIDSEQLVQRVNEPKSVLLEQWDVSDHQGQLQTHLSAMIGKSFDLGSEQLLRAGLIRENESQVTLVLLTHHIAVDGWSVSLLIRELEVMYANRLQGQADTLPALPYQYLDYAAWQQQQFGSESYKRQLEHWRSVLAAPLPMLSLPYDRPRPPLSSHEGRTVVRLLNEDEVQSLKSLAKESGVTLHLLMLTLWTVFLHRYTGDDDLVVGTPVANRERDEWSGAVGLFVNTLVIRSQLHGGMTLGHCLKKVRQSMLDALEAQGVPFESLVRELAPSRDLSKNPLYQVLFVLQNASGEPLKLSGLDVTPIDDVGLDAAKFDLALEMQPAEQGYCLNFNYSTDLFNQNTVEVLAERFVSALSSWQSLLEEPLENLTLMSPPDLHQLRQMGQGARTPVPMTTLAHLFDRQASLTPERTALIAPNQTYRYQELSELKSQIHGELKEQGCRPGDVVAICLPRSAELIAGILATLEAGALWCPVDTEFPAERRRFLVQDSGARFLLNSAGSRFCVEALTVPRQAEADIYASEAAYVFHTSGSSGAPKGVVGTHEGISNRFHWMWNNFPFVDSDVACIKTAIGFIDSIWECFGALLAGVPSVLHEPGGRFNVAAFADMVCKQRVSRLVLVPSLLEALLDINETQPEVLSSLSLCIVSGEALSVTLAKRFYQQCPQARLLNLYGLSEVSADATALLIPKTFEGDEIPLGTPIDNLDILILDASRQRVPQGIVGDIYIGGSGLALSYHDRPELTESTFIANPYGPGRLLRTGDRGLFNPQGELVYRGRQDRQVKIRGVRIDCGDIESALVEHDQIHAARVIPDEHVSGMRLIAHVATSAAIDNSNGSTSRAKIQLPAVKSDTPVAACLPLSEADVRRFLTSRLPAYMMPSAVVLHENDLPRLNNGKVDQQRLLQSDAQYCADDVVPVTLEEEELSPRQHLVRDLWREVLDFPTLSLDDNFFDVGGHSLLAVSLLKRVNDQLGSQLPLSLLFEAPTPREMLLRLDGNVQPDEQPALTLLRSGSTNQRLFMIPPGASTGFFFNRLQQALPPDLGVYAMDSRVSMQYDSVEAVAAHCVREIRDQQPIGPWYVGGACFGNHLAWEIAHQLQSLKGDEVTVFLIDSTAPLNGPGWRYVSNAGGRFHPVTRAKKFVAAYKRDRLRLMLSKRKRQLRALYNPVVKAYNKIGYCQSRQFEQYQAERSNIKIVLFLSDEFRVRENVVERWQALTDREIDVRPVQARYHLDLATPTSRYWPDIARDILAFVRPDNKSGDLQA